VQVHVSSVISFIAYFHLPVCSCEQCAAECYISAVTDCFLEMPHESFILCPRFCNCYLLQAWKVSCIACDLKTLQVIENEWMYDVSVVGEKWKLGCCCNDIEPWCKLCRYVSDRPHCCNTGSAHPPFRYLRRNQWPHPAVRTVVLLCLHFKSLWCDVRHCLLNSFLNNSVQFSSYMIFIMHSLIVYALQSSECKPVRLSWQLCFLSK